MLKEDSDASDMIPFSGTPGERPMKNKRIDSYLNQLTPVGLVALAIISSRENYKGREWTAWADKWLSGEDRSRESIVTMKENNPFKDKFEDQYGSYSLIVYDDAAMAASSAAYYYARYLESEATEERGETNYTSISMQSSNFKDEIKSQVNNSLTIFTRHDRLDEYFKQAKEIESRENGKQDQVEHAMVYENILDALKSVYR